MGGVVMRLIIAEKPDLGRAIADALLTNPRRHGNVISEGDISITWAFGHLFKLQAPEDYDPALKRWALDSLPIFFPGWKTKPDSNKQDQIDLIGSLLEDADLVIHAGDPDDEGQLLIDEILDYFQYRGSVMRLSTNDVTPAAIRKAYSGMTDNRKMRPIGQAAYARTVADFTLGINYSRFFSIKNGATLSVGRVQTPTLGLVIARDALIDGHKKQFYYEGYVHTRIHGDTDSCLKVELAETESAIRDDNGRIVNQAALRKLLTPLAGTTLDITICKQRKEEQPPLPFNLTKLQTAAFQRFKIPPDRTLEITQVLREKYHLITYNRSTCQYLSDEQFAEAPQILRTALANLDTKISGLDHKRKSRAFSTAHVGESAHTAIIPTAEKYNLSLLTEDERRVYKLIALYYLLQFMPPCQKESTTAKGIFGNGMTCSATATRILSDGFRALLPAKQESNHAELPDIPAGSYPNRIVKDVSIIEKETKPPPRYTLASLNEDMTRVSKYVTDERIRRLLLAKDDGKEGENGGIGTPATRSKIVETLVKRGYITIKENKVFSTEMGREFFDILPDEVRKPDLTAEWWAICEDIKTGNAHPEILFDSVNGSIRRLLQSDYQRLSPQTSQVGEICACPRCGLPIRKGNRNFYCTGYKNPSHPCTFKLGETIIGKKLTSKQAATLLQCGRLPAKGLISKAGNRFDATIILRAEDRDGWAQFDLNFD